MERLTRRVLLQALSGLTLGATIGDTLFWRWQSEADRKGLAQSTDERVTLQAPAARQYVVQMRDFFFDPPGLFIQPDDRVLWMLREDVMKDGHSATTYHPNFDKILRIPEQATPWNSGLFKEIGATYEQSFTVNGIYDYFCIPHEDSGMVGRIIVATATGPGTQPVSVGISPAGQAMMPTVDELLGLLGQAFNFQARINTVVFKAEQKAKQEALQLLDALVQDFQAGAGQETSLYEKLKTLGLAVQLLDGLAQLRMLISSEAPLPQTNTQADSLKTLLDKVNRKP